MSAKKFNVGVIGYGFSAKIFHIPFVTYVPELQLYAVVQRHPTPDNDAEKDHPGIKSYRSVDDLVKDENVDLVIVTTAPDQHFPMAKQALEAGKHGGAQLQPPTERELTINQSS
jgi:predicted dehydrogenase